MGQDRSGAITLGNRQVVLEATPVTQESIMDEFEQVQSQAKPGTQGWWDRVLPDLTPEQAEKLDGAAGSRSISHRTISIVLGQWGFDVSAAQVGHWWRSRGA